MIILIREKDVRKNHQLILVLILKICYDSGR